MKSIKTSLPHQYNRTFDTANGQVKFNEEGFAFVSDEKATAIVAENENWSIDEKHTASAGEETNVLKAQIVEQAAQISALKTEKHQLEAKINEAESLKVEYKALEEENGALKQKLADLGQPATGLETIKTDAGEEGASTVGKVEKFKSPAELSDNPEIQAKIAKNQQDALIEIEKDFNEKKTLKEIKPIGEGLVKETPALAEEWKKCKNKSEYVSFIMNHGYGYVKPEAPAEN